MLWRFITFSSFSSSSWSNSAKILSSLLLPLVVSWNLKASLHLGNCFLRNPFILSNIYLQGWVKFSNHVISKPHSGIGEPLCFVSTVVPETVPSSCKTKKERKKNLGNSQGIWTTVAIPILSILHRCCTKFFWNSNWFTCIGFHSVSV